MKRINNVTQVQHQVRHQFGKKRMQQTCKGCVVTGDITQIQIGDTETECIQTCGGDVNGKVTMTQTDGDITQIQYFENDETEQKEKCEYCHETVISQDHEDYCIKFQRHLLNEQLIIMNGLKIKRETLMKFLVMYASHCVMPSSAINKFLGDSSWFKAGFEIGDINTLKIHVLKQSIEALQNWNTKMNFETEQLNELRSKMDGTFKQMIQFISL